MNKDPINAVLIRINELSGKRECILTDIGEMKSEIEVAKIDKENYTKAAKVMSFISEQNQEKIVNLFEYTLSSGLKDLFDESYSFRFELKTRGDSSTAEFEIKCSSFPGWSSILMSHGKSVQEIVAVIFRLLLVKLDKKSRKILILDEPTSGVEPDRQARMSKFLLEICEKFGIQLIVITHSENLCEYADLKVDVNGNQGKKV